MKKINKLFVALAVAGVTMTSFNSCIEETQPTDVATVDQVERSSLAAEALLMAMPAYFNHIWDEDRHWSWGYGAIMRIRDVQAGDIATSSSNYNHYNSWEVNRYMGDGYIYNQFIWNYYYAFVLAANSMINGVNEATATDLQKGYLGAGLAFRALVYLDMARSYEYLPTDGTSNINKDGNDVTNLTIPIVTDTTSMENAKHNPRATREQMKTFILGDLEKAEKYIPFLKDTKGKTLPNLACVYGLMARCYMWVEDYANAKKYARLAINNSPVGPMTEEQALNTTTGFNVTDPWMWGAQQTKEDDCVQTGIINWTSWMSSESTFGYCGTGTGMTTLIDAAMYERISDTDWRKLEFKAPSGSALASKVRFANPTYAAEYDDLTIVKFRCGGGNIEDYTTGATTAYPIMRVEEMYFIEAEAAAHINESEGRDLIIEFMKNYRDPNYTTVASGDRLIEEIVFQKRVEFILEGQSFFDIKRLDYPVIRGYAGTNHYASARLNTTRRPAYMNYVMVRTEANNNDGVKGMNNPDPSDVYTPWTAQ